MLVQLDPCDVILSIKRLLADRIHLVVVLPAQRLDTLPEGVYLSAVPAITHPVHLVDVRFAAADRTAPVGHTRI